jgi:hypothetical protein
VGGSLDRGWCSRVCFGNAETYRIKFTHTPHQTARVAACTYSAAGKRLYVREVNGHLLVRTGGGYEDLMSVLAKLPRGGAGGVSARRVAAAPVLRSSFSAGGGVGGARYEAAAAALLATAAW